MPLPRILCCLLLLALACPGPARAQSVAADNPPTVHVGGYIQYDYLAALGERASGDATFRFRRVRLAIGGAATEKVDYLVTIEATTTPILRDAFITLKYVPAATVRLGQFVMPNGQEQYVFSSNSMEFTERILTPLIASRDAGIAVFNAHPFGGWFSYAAGITNGTGQNVRDDNGAKDAMLRLTAMLPAIPGLQVSVGGVRGEQPSGTRTRRGADISFDRKDYHLAAEFQSERFDGRPDRDGYYVLGSWRFYPESAHRSFHHLEFGSRVGRITGGDPFGQVEFAANYYVRPNVRFMSDYIIHTDRGPGAPRRTFHARANIRF
jgi:hypothetical protein